MEKKNGSNTVAALLEKTVSEENAEKTIKSKLIIIANNMFATDTKVNLGNSEVAAILFYDNRDFVLNCVQNIAEIEDPITIRKPIEETYYTATEEQDTVVRTIIFAIPVIIVIFGIVIWQLRRRKK